MFSISASAIVWHNLIVCLENWKRYCRLVYESPVAQNCSVTANHSWTGIAARNLVSLFTIFGPTKFISSSESVGAFRVNFLYRPLNSWHFKSANKTIQLYTDLFLYNSVYHQRLSRCFLLLDVWRANMKAAPATCKDISPPGASNTGGSHLNFGVSRTPFDYVTLLRSAECSSVYAACKSGPLARYENWRGRIYFFAPGEWVAIRALRQTVQRRNGTSYKVHVRGSWTKRDHLSKITYVQHIHLRYNV